MVILEPESEPTERKIKKRKRRKIDFLTIAILSLAMAVSDNTTRERIAAFILKALGVLIP